MADSAAVAEGFFDAWTSKDFQRARALLHDDVHFAGPIDTFSDADNYVASLRQLSGIVTGADKQKVFVDGDDVCVIYDLKNSARAQFADLRVVSHPRRQDRVGLGHIRRPPLRLAVRGAVDALTGATTGE
jgi:hypothetical protein